eukprot:CAMPEP_0119551582 /NCGR_PEP_ID=MMETSP1352-20130426/4789_1 /TAXON_ID=265584 /ORGANISM="Stauroneis constricta, Strain CCMP1120" /LENGTH=400 /DNA_ID=CAMNT_0007597663 /DNA_START=48 /DNA_END=1250 /DNA_ORIENTATION=-
MTLQSLPSGQRLELPSAVVNDKYDLNFGVEVGDHVDANNGNATFRCEWKHNGTLDACFDLLSRRLDEREISHRQPWIVLGDSTMNKMVTALVSGLHRPDLIAPGVSLKLKMLRRNDRRCQWMVYFGFPALNNDIDPDDRIPWVLPNYSRGEGPVLYGAKNPFCYDSSTPVGQLHNIFLNSSSANPEFTEALTTLEYFAVDSARDVSLPTKTTTTTQETALRYLRKQYQGTKSANTTQSSSASSSTQQQDNRAICIVNTGLHDMIIPNITTRLYVHNVLDYWKLLLTTDDERFHPACAHLIWVSTSATMGFDKVIRNDFIEEWNQALLDLFSSSSKRTPTQAILTASFLRDHITIVDVYDNSLHAKHMDNVHLDPEEYYAPFSILFLNLTTHQLQKSLENE